MSLNDWLADGHIRRQSTSKDEILRLLAVVDRDLADASVGGVSADRRFATAYGAALGLAGTVLRASGYRTSASASGHHWRTLALLPELMGPAQSTRRAYLDACRRARNAADYERTDVASEADLLELLQDTLAFHDEVIAWLCAEHPGLV